MKRAAALLTALTLLCSCALGQGTQPAGAQEQNNPPTGAEEQSELQAGKEEQNEVPAETKDQSDLSASGINEIQISAEELPPAGTLPQVVFPDWKGYADDTLAMNSMYSFYGCHGQGTVYVSVSGAVESFSMYINNAPVATDQMEAGGTYRVDFSSCALDGVNTLQVSNICPAGLEKAVTVTTVYPEVLEGTPEEVAKVPQSYTGQFLRKML